MKDKKAQAVELAGPREQAKAANAISLSTMLTGLSPWERHKIEWQARRQRGELVAKLAEVEVQTVVTEAVQLGEQRTDIAQEQALIAVYEKQVECLLTAGRLRDEAIVEAMKLTAGSGELVAGAIDRVTGSYVSRMERRAAGGGCFG